LRSIDSGYTATLIWLTFPLQIFFPIMRASLVSLGVFAGLASANIKFHWVQPTCDYDAVGQTSCLRGQHCTKDNVSVDSIHWLDIHLTDYAAAKLLTMKTFIPVHFAAMFQSWRSVLLIQLTALVDPTTETLFATQIAPFILALAAVNMVGYEERLPYG
jgi:hypothetical protein